jgi:hypothetical protein
MAAIIMDGKFKIWLTVTIANIAAPTVAELNAGITIGPFLTGDGLVGFAPDTQEVDVTPINSPYGLKRGGSADLSGTMLRFMAQYPTDTIKTLLTVGYLTHLVVRRDGTAETVAWAASQKVEVWPIECGARRDLDYARNESQKYEIPALVYLQPNQNATVAA